MVIEPAWVSAWHDHRTACGWVVVRSGVEIPIADWKADLRSWCRNERQKPTPSVSGKAGTGKKKERGAVSSWAERQAEKDQAADDQFATLKVVPLVVAEPDFDWRPLCEELYGFVPATWGDVPEDNRLEIERTRIRK